MDFCKYIDIHVAFRINYNNSDGFPAAASTIS